MEPVRPFWTRGTIRHRKLIPVSKQQRQWISLFTQVTSQISMTQHCSAVMCVFKRCYSLLFTVGWVLHGAGFSAVLCDIPSACNQLSHCEKNPSLNPCWRDVFRTEISHFQGLCVYWHEETYSSSKVKRRRHERGKGKVPSKPVAITLASDICLMQVMVYHPTSYCWAYIVCACVNVCMQFGNPAWQGSFILFLLFSCWRILRILVKKEKTCRNPFLWPHLPWKFLWSFLLESFSLLTQEDSCSAPPWGHRALQH